MEVALYCPVPPFPSIPEEVVVREAFIEGSDPDSSIGVVGVEVALDCPVSPFPGASVVVLVRERVIEGSDPCNSIGVIPAEMLSELCMEEDTVYSTVFEVGMRGKNDAWLDVLAPLACVPLCNCVNLLDGAIVVEMAWSCGAEETIAANEKKASIAIEHNILRYSNTLQLLGERPGLQYLIWQMNVHAMCGTQRFKYTDIVLPL